VLIINFPLEDIKYPRTSIRGYLHFTPGRITGRKHGEEKDVNILLPVTVGLRKGTDS
jgi:hypothetical protein